MSTTKFKNLSQEDTECLRYESERRLKAAWANIIKRYQNLSNNETDEIDLRSQTVVIDRGVIQNYNEHKLGTAFGMHFSNAPIEDADDDTVWLLDSSAKNKVKNENNNEITNKSNNNSLDVKDENTSDLDKNVKTSPNPVNNVDTQVNVQRRLQVYSMSKSPPPVHTTKISSQVRRLQLYSTVESGSESSDEEWSNVTRECAQYWLGKLHL
ncbi:7811_t:CDS:1 [Cetraspora pellucida]|uniref:7811_t:CDS:1 n=1 Tax=Cetraspora pellucida TaxID=1433469 RepID=A0A9N9CT40_9GLOM|nr:7811_t:CDS:1 [Cetraspora pellucida]